MVMRSRGQLLPLWTVGILASLVLMYFAINYGNMLRWQIRAQNNADAAASTFVAMQTESWNQATALLFAADIEEFRIRKQLDNLSNIIHNAGGCTASGGGTTNVCRTSWNAMYPFFRSAVTRYTADAMVLQSVIENGTFTKLYDKTSPTSDMNLLLADLNKGSTTTCIDPSTPASWKPQNGDCSFYYQVLAVQQRTGVLSASQDAWNRSLPIPGSTYSYIKPLTAECALVSNPVCDTSGITSDFQNAGQASPKFNNELFAPVQIEVSVCSRVPPIIRNFFGLQQPNDYYAVGRAAATAVIVDQDWLQPGAFQRGYNTSGQTNKFQDPESYDTYAEGQAYGPQQYLNLDFGGTAWFDFGDHYEWNGNPTSDFEGEAAWWASIPIAPFSQINDVAAENAIGTRPSGANSCQKKRSP